MRKISWIRCCFYEPMVMRSKLEYFEIRSYRTRSLPKQLKMQNLALGLAHSWNSNINSFKNTSSSQL